MGVMTTLAFVRDLLDGQNVPGPSGRMHAFVSPPDPETETHDPHAYIWLVRGTSRRVASPRSAPPPNLIQNVPTSPAGWKKYTHNVSIWLTWFEDNYQPSQSDAAFPTVLDWTMMILETCRMPFTTVDPSTGLYATLINLGQNLEYDYTPVRSTASQRTHRQDAQITAPTEEWVQR